MNLSSAVCEALNLQYTSALLGFKYRGVKLVICPNVCNRR